MFLEVQFEVGRKRERSEEQSQHRGPKLVLVSCAGAGDGRVRAELGCVLGDQERRENPEEKMLNSV